MIKKESGLSRRLNLQFDIRILILYATWVYKLPTLLKAIFFLKCSILETFFRAWLTDSKTVSTPLELNQKVFGSGDTPFSTSLAIDILEAVLSIWLSLGLTLHFSLSGYSVCLCPSGYSIRLCPYFCTLGGHSTNLEISSRHNELVSSSLEWIALSRLLPTLILIGQDVLTHVDLL